MMSSVNLQNKIVLKAQEEIFRQFLIFNPFVSRRMKETIIRRSYQEEKLTEDNHLEYKEKELTEKHILESVRQLIQTIRENGGNIDCEDKEMGTFVSLAVENNCPKILELLIEAKADFNWEPKSKGISRNPYLTIATEKNFVECVDVLLKARANAEEKNMWKKNSLYIASEKGFDRCIHLLLNAKANPNPEKKTYKESTPMSVAILRYYCNGRDSSSRRCIELLRTAGAKPISKLDPLNTQDVEQKTQLLLALNQFETVDLYKNEIYRKGPSSELDKSIKRTGRTLPFALLMIIAEYLEDYNDGDCYDRAFRISIEKERLTYHSQLTAIVTISFGVGFFVCANLFSASYQSLTDAGTTPAYEAIKNSFVLGASFFAGGLIRKFWNDKVEDNERQVKRMKTR
jgi:ankyrin repeat protein